MLSWLYVIPIIVIGFFASFGWNFATKYQEMAAKIPELQHEIDLRDGREASFRRQIDRRDAAIGASKCAAQIQKWVKNPDDIPKPFQPFNQLENPGKNYGP